MRAPKQVRPNHCGRGAARSPHLYTRAGREAGTSEPHLRLDALSMKSGWSACTMGSHCRPRLDPSQKAKEPMTDGCGRLQQQSPADKVERKAVTALIPSRRKRSIIDRRTGGLYRWALEPGVLVFSKSRISASSFTSAAGSAAGAGGSSFFSLFIPLITRNKALAMIRKFKVTVRN